MKAEYNVNLVTAHAAMPGKNLQISTATLESCVWHRNPCACRLVGGSCLVGGSYLSSSLASDALGMIGLSVPSLRSADASWRCLGDRSRCLGERSRLWRDLSWS